MNAKTAYDASIILASLKGDIKNDALKAISDALISEKDKIFAANNEDIKRAEKEGLDAPLLKRLKMNDDKIADLVKGINDLINMPDPVGVTQLARQLSDGLELYRVACPIGVIGMIFESRPDALVQISTLCLKSGNAVILKGGSEAMCTNKCLAELIEKAGVAAGLPKGFITLLETRAEVAEMLKEDEYIDLIIPRGSNEFVRYIMDNSKIPVMGHADGICHLYIDSEFDKDIATKVVVDSKTQYVAVCNALETLLVHEKAAKEILPLLKIALENKGVEIRGCDKTRAIIDCKEATEEDYKTEYLDLILSIKVVSSIDEAIDHINTYGSSHTDGIITANTANAEKFLNLVDSGNCYLNCSTRFSDGYRYGFGAEVGISTNKIHARGPVGLEGLMIYKYKLIGSGHTVSDFAEKKSVFDFKDLKKDCPI